MANRSKLIFTLRAPRSPRGVATRRVSALLGLVAVIGGGCGADSKHAATPTASPPASVSPSATGLTPTPAPTTASPTGTATITRVPTATRTATALATATVSATQTATATATTTLAPTATVAPTFDCSVPCPGGDCLPRYLEQFAPLQTFAGGSPPFPAEFRWGAALSANQTEGNNRDSDWWVWERLPRTVVDGTVTDQGPDHWTHFRDDIDELAALGLDTFRFGIEWAKIFPTRARFDALDPEPTAVAHYHDVLAALRARGIQPVVTVHHFTSPAWWIDVTAPREERLSMGFGADDAADVFARWAGWLGAEFGGEVDMWVTINEPFVLVQGAYLVNFQPPGVGLDPVATPRAWRNLIFAHVAAYDALRAADTVDADADGRPMIASIAEASRVYFPSDPCRAADQVAAARFHYQNNQLFLNAIVRGDLDANFDGDLNDDMDRRGDPDLAGRADFVGINYYTFNVVTAAPLTPFPGVPAGAGSRVPYPKNDIGWDVFPAGLRLALEDASRYRLPIYVLENGTADAGDTVRPRFVLEHLHVLARAIADGIDVRGYLHWSLIDNFEWRSGLCPRFGLYEIDYDDPLRRRTRRGSADVLAAVIDARRVTDAMLHAHPTYGEPSVRCQRF